MSSDSVGIDAADAKFLAKVIERAVKRVVRSIVKDPHKLFVSFHPDAGPVLVVIVETSARKALEYWLQLARSLKPVRRFMKIYVYVAWTGEDDVSDDEFDIYLLGIMHEQDGLLVIPPELSEEDADS